MKRMIFTILACAALAGCGIKPSTVEPPAGAEGDSFPRTYPDVSTDPAPARGGQ